MELDFKKVEKDKNIRVSIDTRNEKIGYKIREARLEKVPYMFIVGDKEAESNSVSVWIRGQGDKGQVSLDEIILFTLLFSQSSLIAITDLLVAPPSNLKNISLIHFFLILTYFFGLSKFKLIFWNKSLILSTTSPHCQIHFSFVLSLIPGWS